MTVYVCSLQNLEESTRELVREYIEEAEYCDIPTGSTMQEEYEDILLYAKVLGVPVDTRTVVQEIAHRW